MYNIKDLVDHENEVWTDAFQSELEKDNSEMYSSYWWEQYYCEMRNVLLQKISLNDLKEILEVGGGSGKASYMLQTTAKITILDISSVALTFARHLAQKLQIKNNVIYLEADAFNLSFLKQKYDLVWSVGLVEHYTMEEIYMLVKEQIDKVKIKGYFILAVPNFWSGPTLKAWALKHLKFIPGYKLDTEKFFSDKQINSIVEKVCKKNNRSIEEKNIVLCGNYLFIEAPKPLLKFSSKFYKFLNKFRFLKIYIYKIN
jgi:SAM-dependent methyltransferase